jgi:hypothetical protein
MPRTINVNGNIYEIELGLITVNGEFYVSIPALTACIGGFIVEQGTGRISYLAVEIGNDATSMGTNLLWRYRYIMNFATEILGANTTPAPAQPTTRPPNLQTPNILENPAEVMQEIREIGIAPGSNSDEVVIMLPLITPEHFPDIPAEHFPAFALELIRSLGRTDVIMPWHELSTININMIPQLKPKSSTVTRPGENIDYTGQLEDIHRELININRTFPQRIGDVFLGSPAGLDFSPLQNLGAVAGVFPFSIPWDLRNAFVAMFGDSPTQAPAPVFEIDLSDTVFAQTVRLDFSNYELMAIAVRWGLMALFVTGLIKATSGLIKW